MPTTKLDDLEARTELAPSSVHETQPYLACGVKGGDRPGRGKVMVDTGAAFTMISAEVARLFGLVVRPSTAKYAVASGDTAQLTGVTDFTLQVADELELVLKGVRVQEPRQVDQYIFLLGSDVLRPHPGQIA